MDQRIILAAFLIVMAAASVYVYSIGGFVDLPLTILPATSPYITYTPTKGCPDTILIQGLQIYPNGGLDSLSDRLYIEARYGDIGSVQDIKISQVDCEYFKGTWEINDNECDLGDSLNPINIERVVDDDGDEFLSFSHDGESLILYPSEKMLPKTFSPSSVKIYLKNELGSCNPETCFDGILNQNEADVDCGGVCLPCIVPPEPPPEDDDVPQDDEFPYMLIVVIAGIGVMMLVAWKYL